MGTSDKRTEHTAELAAAIYSVKSAVVDHVNGRLAQFDLTRTDVWALRTIDGPMPMKELAHRLDFDPSYVTAVADRLESRGLIERRSDLSDRRVKNLVLTDKGRQLQQDIPKIVWAAENTFTGLSHDERADLLRLLTKVIPKDAD